MMTTSMISATAQTDSELIRECLSGNTEAFGQIVVRYQTLVCSLAYSATGSVSQSEDLAQDTFVTAWKQLPELREPEKLRSWLCGIARNLIHNWLRKQRHEPGRSAEPLEENSGLSSMEPLPVEQTMTREEEAILWRSLSRIPEIYREPLILFYREHQSIETVAENLDLSVDAVKQRLSRGRKLLQEQYLKFVEGALSRSNPGKAFTLAVLASLPALTFSAKAATAGAAVATSGAAAKTAGTMGLLSLLLGPLAVVLPNYIAYRSTLAGAASDQERAAVKSLFGKIAIITLGLFIPIAVVVLWLSRHETDHSYLSGLFATILVLIYLPTIWILSALQKPCEKLAVILEQKYAGVFPKPAWEYRSQASLFGLPLVHIRVGDRFALLKGPVKAWVAIGSNAIGGLFALGGQAMAPLSIGGFSVGIISLGGIGVGMFALGGVALGVWTLFGGLTAGWQAAGSCIAIGWRSAVGDFGLARDFAAGHFAWAAHANNDAARQFIESTVSFRLSDFINDHWLWLNLVWLIPFLVAWAVTTKSNTKN
ncbi:MAG TPA: sigma-70 family RNA polymerase sigma factor [Candidatus Sulfotelmatobacter sp.]|nr:sigma-70 family RNA polymerase sigma factor [Candidatus Sulfotelmatobacter sp.]